MAASGVDSTRGLSAQCVSMPSAVRNKLNEGPNDNAQDNALVLTRDQLQQVDQFRNQLLGRAGDADKFKLCVEKCNELLGLDARLQHLIATYDDIMSAACRRYQNKKQEKAKKRALPPTSAHEEANNNAECDEWERYFGVAILAAQVKSNCLIALKAVAKRWGREVVVHYEWSSRGEYFCNLLRAGAIDVPQWSDAAMALTIIMCRRHAAVQRPSIARSRDPVTSADLKELRKFSKSEIRDTMLMLPIGFGLDKFGIVVHEIFAEPQIPSVRRSSLTEAIEPPGSANDTERPGVLGNKTSSLDSSTQRSLRPSVRRSYKETPIRGSARTSRTLQVKASTASAEPEAPSPSCCHLPSILLGVLDSGTNFNPAEFSAFRSQLCHHHTQRLLDQVWVDLPTRDQVTSPAGLPTRRRASLPAIIQTFKRPRLGDPHSPCSITGHGTELLHDPKADEIFRSQALAELLDATHTLPPGSHGKQTVNLVHALLVNMTPPNTDRNCGSVNALFCTGIEAADLVESGSSLSVPIITSGEQQFLWNKNDRPIAQLFHRMTHLDRTVPVQIPSRGVSEDSFEARTLSEVRQRFLYVRDTANPWNLLDLQSPLPSSILPKFLTGENSGLLLHVRNTILMEKSAERVASVGPKWNQWKNVLEWVLLSEGGHQTAPHTDSNGLSTWITVQEGCMGFGWMVSSTETEENEWMTNNRFTGGRWRYVVLKPGQTIFFTSGTIHFVFRTQAQQTLALGGHVLQWSGIERWIRVVLAQMANPTITNESMQQTAPLYVHTISKLVETRIAEGRIEELGGDAAVKRFQAAVEEFNQLYVWRKPGRKK